MMLCEGRGKGRGDLQTLLFAMERGKGKGKVSPIDSMLAWSACFKLRKP